MSNTRRRKIKVWLNNPSICYLCLKPLTIDNMTVDHVMLKSLNKNNDRVSLRPCCFKCNQTKGSKTLIEYLSSQIDNKGEYK